MNIAGQTGTPAGTAAAMATSFIGTGVIGAAAVVVAAGAAVAEFCWGLIAIAKYTAAAIAAVTAVNVAAAANGRTRGSGAGACFSASLRRAKKSAEGSIRGRFRTTSRLRRMRVSSV